MPAYCALADLEVRFTAERVAQVFSVQSADGSTTGVADAASVLAACNDVTARISSRLGGVYVVPFVAPIDDVILDLACDMAMWVGIRRRPEFVTQERFRPYADLYKDATAQLEDIRTDKARISAAKVPANAGGVDSYTTPDAATPFYFQPDPNDPRKHGMQGF